MSENRGLGGLEGGVQGRNVMERQVANWAGDFSPSTLQMMGFNKDNFFNQQVDTYFQLNSDKEWMNFDIWGSSMIPLDGEASNFMT